MSNYIASDTDLTAVADAIRTKGNTQAALEFPSGFVSAIGNIPTGGGSSVQQKDVNFFDYDGTCVAAYTAAEFANLSAMPANPTHQGLTAQGWNWSLADAKTYVATYGMLNIGQMYTTADGKTRLYITIPSNAPTYARTLELKFGITSGSVTVDYGDGSSPVTTTDAYVSLTHDYTNTGDYVITLTVNSGTVQLNSKIFNDSNANANLRAWLTRVEVGGSVTSIGDNTFSNCYALQSVTIPSSVTSIGDSSFYYCYSLQSVTIPSNVASIGTNTFSTCASLQSVTIPSNVASIGRSAFYNCYPLRAIHFKPTTPPSVSNSNAWTGLQTSCKIYVPTGKLSSYTSAQNYPDPNTYTYVEE